MCHKTAKTAGVALVLAVLASATRAETTKLTDAQMDQITAGAFLVSPSPTSAGGPAPAAVSAAVAPVLAPNLNLNDINGNTYSFRLASNDFLDNHGFVWQPVVIDYYSSNVAVGVLYNTATGQTWNGGYVDPDPQSLGPVRITVFFR